MPKCVNCDKEAVHDYGGVLVCIEHSYQMQQIGRAAAELSASMVNSLRDQIYASTGYRAPYVRVPPPLPPNPGAVALNNITVNDSTVGVINTGTVQNLDNGITVVHGQDANLGDAAKAFTQALIDADDIKGDQKEEAAELLEHLLAEVARSEEERRPALARRALEGLNAIAVKVATLGAAWAVLHPLLIAALKLTGQG